MHPLNPLQPQEEDLKRELKALAPSSPLLSPPQFQKISKENWRLSTGTLNASPASNPEDLKRELKGNQGKPRYRWTHMINEKISKENWRNYWIRRRNNWLPTLEDLKRELKEFHILRLLVVSQHRRSQKRIEGLLSAIRIRLSTHRRRSQKRIEGLDDKKLLLQGKKARKISKENWRSKPCGTMWTGTLMPLEDLKRELKVQHCTQSLRSQRRSEERISKENWRHNPNQHLMRVHQ